MTKKSARQLVSPTRRRLLQALPLLGLPGLLRAQPGAGIALRKLHSFDLQVSDVARSLAFYQQLFAAPVQARQGERVCLRIGTGPHYFSLSPQSEGNTPHISQIGLSVANFDIERVREQLLAFGISRAPVPEPGQPALHKALQSWVEVREPSSGGAATGTPELYFADIEGLVFHLTATDYCGGSGVTGNVCNSIETAETAGLMELVDISHFTNFVSNRERANTFYTATFNKDYQVYQGPNAPVIGIGDGIQFLMFIGGAQSGPPEAPATIHHACFSVNDFNVAELRARLTSIGLSPLADGEEIGPMKHWVSMRMPDRGGAPGGTPELYFTDPDGIRIQLQDPGYCGGTGYLGDSCPAL